jgi:hypothetical protein
VNKRALGKIFLMAAAIALAASITVFGSFSVLTSTSSNALTNTATVKMGEVAVALTEGDGWGQSKEIVPGGPAIAKRPVITNAGSVDSYIRITVAGLESYEVTFADGYDDYWERADDGSDVWYYTGVVPPAGETYPLFTHVKLESTYSGDGSDLNIIVYGEAIQAHGLKDSSGAPVTSCKEAFTLFDEGDAA